MGRKTSQKGKEKKRQRKEVLAHLKVAMKTCDEANLVHYIQDPLYFTLRSQIANPMSELAAFKQYDRNGLTVSIDCYHQKDLSEKDLEWAFNLTKKNMEHLYRMCEWGWKDQVKKDEMVHEKCRYLIAKDQKGTPLAFVNFRFDVDWEVEVVYCYEIQLEPTARGKGLGKFLMQILEMMAFKTNMKKVVLTAFKHNPNAMRFFKLKLGYEQDETSPDPTVGEEDFYEVLSKPIGNRKDEHQHSEHCCH